MQSNKKLRMTCQRRVILEELQKVHSHPTVDEIYEMVRKRLPRISLGTVYRNLEILTKLGILQKLEKTGTHKRFDSRLDDHSHIRCVRCGMLQDLDTEPRIEMPEALNQITNFEVTGYCLEYIGICSSCSEAQKE